MTDDTPTETPALTFDEFQARVNALAKDAIREYCGNDDGTVDISAAAVRTAASETVYECDLLDDYPLSVLAYRHPSARFPADAEDYLTGIGKMWAYLRRCALEATLEQRIKALLGGEWDAIHTETDTETVTYERKVFRGPDANE